MGGGGGSCARWRGRPQWLRHGGARPPVVVAVSGGKRKKKGEGGFGVLRFHERVA
jgi:hypothetical protein